jgi:hypothetical protein
VSVFQDTPPIQSTGKIWLVDTPSISPIIRGGLQLGLNFTALPSKHIKSFIHNATFHSKTSQEQAPLVLGKLEQTIPRVPLFYNNRDQNISRMFLKSPELTKLLEDHIITDTDKNMGVSVVSKKWYNTQGFKLLANRKEYSIIATKVDDTWLDSRGNLLAHDLKEYSRVLASEFKNQLVNVYGFSNQLATQMTPFESQYNISYFKLLPKVHKNPISARPIVASHSTFTTKASIILTAALGSLEIALKAKFPTYYLPITNSKEAVERTQQAINLFTNVPNSNVKIKSYDFTSLYTNLDIEVVISNISSLCDLSGLNTFGYSALLVSQGDWNSNLQRHLRNLPDEVKGSFTKAQLLGVLSLVLNYNYFVFQDVLFKQISGIAMGTNCGPIVANLTLAYCEIKYSLDTHKLDTTRAQYHDLKYFSRYIDDLLVIYDSNIGEPDLNISPIDEYLPLTFIYQRYCGPKITLSQTKIEPLDGYDWTIYLDLRLNFSDGIFNFRTFRKPGNAYQYPSFFSYIPSSIKKGFIIGEFIRLTRTNSKGIWFRNELTLFVHFLQARGYPLSFIWKSIDSYLDTSEPSEYTASLKGEITPFRVVVDFHATPIKPITFERKEDTLKALLVPRTLPQISKQIAKRSSLTEEIGPLEQRPRKVSKTSSNTSNIRSNEESKSRYSRFSRFLDTSSSNRDLLDSSSDSSSSSEDEDVIFDDPYIYPDESPGYALTGSAKKDNPQSPYPNTPEDCFSLTPPSLPLSPPNARCRSLGSLTLALHT